MPRDVYKRQIEYIMASGGSLFDYDLVKEFINKIIPYPIGTLVRLSNGCIASVESVTPDPVSYTHLDVYKRQVL